MAALALVAALALAALLEAALALADALAKSVDCTKIYESEDRLAADAYFSLLHYAAGEEEIPPAEWEYFLDCLNGDREYRLEDKLKI